MNSKIALGVDLGWVSQLEDRGITWAGEDGRPADPVLEARNLGADAVRLRVFVNPPAEAYWDKPDGARCMLGYCDGKSVLAMSRRVKALGMRLMIDFHYSDHFADPQYQHIPEAWKDFSPEQLAEAVAVHTRDTLRLLTAEEIFPDWVQVGNEINPGLLLPKGSRKEHPKQMIRFLNAGYDAVKECCPDALVVTHTAGVPLSDVCREFYDLFFDGGGKTDVLGLSYYPYWYQMALENRAWMSAGNNRRQQPQEKPGGGAEGRMQTAGTPGDGAEGWPQAAEVQHGAAADSGAGMTPPKKDLSPAALKAKIRKIIARYQKPVLVAEIGGPDDEPQETRRLLADTIAVLRETAAETGTDTGIFYWEPEANRALLPDAYPLGAARLLDAHTLQYTEALQAYRDSRGTE